jgi:hypothetical protein
VDDELYAQLAGRGPNDALLGHAFISLVEPHRGHESAYTRWYEDDHFHAGAMAFPWWFSGRRWLAPAALRAQRASSDPTADLDLGWTLGTYWITAQRLTEQARWLEATIARLRPAGRMFEERTHVMTGFFDLRSEWQRVGHQPRAVHALEYPYGGVVLEIIDPVPGADLSEWLRTDYISRRLTVDGAGQCLWFAPVPWPGAGPTSWFEYADGVASERAVLLWFLDEAPSELWADTFGQHRSVIEASGAGSLAFVGGFVPAMPGTDRYLDQIR